MDDTFEEAIDEEGLDELTVENMARTVHEEIVGSDFHEVAVCELSAVASATDSHLESRLKSLIEVCIGGG